MFTNCLKIAALSFGLAMAAGTASATPLASASKAAMVFDGSEAVVQPMFHGRHFRRYGHRRFHGPVIRFGFGPYYNPYYGYPYYGPRVGFGLSAPHGHFVTHDGGFRSLRGGQGQGR